MSRDSSEGALMFALTVAGLAALVIVGCKEALQGEKPERKPVEAAITDAPDLKRFRVLRHGWFKAGFDDNKREILTIKDLDTGQEYLGITGVGVTELHAVGGKPPRTIEP